MPTEKHKRARKKKKLKERERLLKSNKSICHYCGFIGKPKKIKKGSWFMFFIKVTVVIPATVMIITLSMLEGLIRMIAFSRPCSVIWNIGFESFFPHFPHNLSSCPECAHANSMKGLRSQKGLHIYERFERDHFIMRR